MNNAVLMTDAQDIVVNEVFPHAPETIWRALTTSTFDGTLVRDGANRF